MLRQRLRPLPRPSRKTPLRPLRFPHPAPLPHPGTRACSSQTLRRTRQSQLEPSPGVKVRQSSNRNMLGAYGPEKAVDGNTSSELSDGFHQRHRRGGRKTAWFGIDFGKETNRTIEKVVIYTPANLTLLGTMEEFKVILYDNDKNVHAGKNLQHHTLGKIHQRHHLEAGSSGQGARPARGITIRPIRWR